MVKKMTRMNLLKVRKQIPKAFKPKLTIGLSSFKDQ